MGLHPASSSPFRSVIALTFVVLWLLISRVSNAVIMGDVNTAGGLPSPNMTRLQHTLNVSTPTRSQKYHCTDSREWIGHDREYKITDCFNARHKFWKEMIENREPEQLVEYMGNDAVPITRLAKIKTPLRFTFGKWIFTLKLVFHDQGPSGLIIRTWH